MRSISTSDATSDRIGHSAPSRKSGRTVSRVSFISLVQRVCATLSMRFVPSQFVLERAPFELIFLEFLYSQWIMEGISGSFVQR